MAISFRSSLTQNESSQDTKYCDFLNNPAVYSTGTDAWIRDDRYLFYEDYTDTDVSVIDRLKNVELSQTQSCLTQESNSQLITFEMDRHYDNFDLCNTLLTIHFVNAESDEAEDSPVNVHYNSKKIRFGWLVDNRVTQVAGRVLFEIVAVGVNAEGETYVWKTKPCNSLSIIRSLAGTGVIEPDDSWNTGLILQMTQFVGRAEAAANSIEDASSITSEAAGRAEAAAAIAREAANKVTLDKTLTIEGQSADAKAVGDRIDLLLQTVLQIRDDLNALRSDMKSGFDIVKF